MSIEKPARSRYRGGRKALLLASLAVVMVLLVAACGSDDDSSTGTSASAETTAQSSEGGKFTGEATVGLIVPLTGELGDFGKSWQQAGEFAAEEINAADTGLTVKTVVADGKTNAETGVNELRKMISTEGVSAVVGPTSELMVAMTPIAKREQIPVISSAAGTVQLNELGGDYIYRTVASDASDGKALARILEEQNATGVSMLIEQQGSLPSIAATIKQSFEEGGGKIDQTVTFNPGQSSYRTEVGKLLGGNPQWIICACGQQAGVSIIKEIDAAGYDGEWLLSSDLSTQGTIDAIGAKVMEGMNSESPSTDQDSPQYKAFAKGFKAKYGDEPGFFVANTYDAVILVGLAMLKAGSTEGEAINGALREVANPEGTKVTTFAEGAKALAAGEEINYEGASGPVDFDDTGTVASSYSILKVEDGVWKQVEYLPASEFSEAG